MSFNSSSASKDLHNWLSDRLTRDLQASPGLYEFGTFLKNNPQYYDKLLLTATQIFDEFERSRRYSYGELIAPVAGGVLGKLYLDFVKEKAPADYRPNSVDLTYEQAATALRNEYQKIDNSQSSSGWGSGGQSGWGSGSTGSRGEPPTFGSGRQSSSMTTNTSGGSSLMAQATVAASASTRSQNTNTNTNWGSGAKETTAPQQNNQAGGDVEIQPLSAIPYYIKDYHKLVVDKNNIAIYQIDEAEHMKLDYYRHELNTEFLEAVKRDGVLRPESHFEVTGNMLTAISNPIQGTGGINEELKKLNELLEARGETQGDVDLGILRSVRMPVTYAGPTVMDVVTTVTGELAAEGLAHDHLYAEFSMEREQRLYVREGDGDLINGLTEKVNLQTLGDRLFGLKGKISDKVWYALESRLTQAMNQFLGSTLPLFVQLESFVNDYAQLSTYMFDQLKEENYPVDTQIAIVQALSVYLTDVLGTFELEAVEGTTVEENSDVDVLREAMYGQHKYHRLINKVRENYLMVGFNAAELRLALPAIVNEQGVKAEIQPTGGIVDGTTMPKLYKAIQILLNNNPEGITYILTNDNYRCRVSRALLESEYFVLDLPTPIV